MEVDANGWWIAGRFGAVLTSPLAEALIEEGRTYAFPTVQCCEVTKHEEDITWHTAVAWRKSPIFSSLCDHCKAMAAIDQTSHLEKSIFNSISRGSSVWNQNTRPIEGSRCESTNPLITTAKSYISDDTD